MWRPQCFRGRSRGSESQSRLVTGAEALIFQGFPVLRLIENMQATGQDQKGASNKAHFSDSLIGLIWLGTLWLFLFFLRFYKLAWRHCLSPEESDDDNDKITPRGRGRCACGCRCLGQAAVMMAVAIGLVCIVLATGLVVAAWMRFTTLQFHCRRKKVLLFRICVGNCMAWVGFRVLRGSCFPILCRF